MEAPDIIQKLIEKFDGEIKNDRWKKYTYKRTYHKSKHKYGERKDW